MNWNGIVEVFSEPVFTLGKTPVSWGTLLQFVFVVALVFLLSHYTRTLLRTRVLVHTRLDPGSNDGGCRCTMLRSKRPRISAPVMCPSSNNVSPKSQRGGQRRSSIVFPRRAITMKVNP